MPSVTLGPTKLKLWDACPQRFAFRHLERSLPDPDTPQAELGRAFHEFAEAYLSYCWALNVPNDRDHALSLVDTIAPGLRFNVSEQFRSLAALWINDYTAPGKTDRCGVETSLGLTEDTHEAAPYECAPLRGRVDLWLESDGKLTVHDYKSGHVMPSQQDVEDDIQLAVSAYLLWRTLADPDIWAVRVQLQFARYLGNHDRGIRTADYPISRLVKVGDWIRYQTAAIRAVERGEKKPATHVGEQCRTCEFVGQCPAYGASIPQTLAKPEDVTPWLAMIEALESDLAKRKAVVRSWVAEHGPVPGVEVSARETMTATAQQVVDAVVRRGGTPGSALELLRPDARAVKKLPREIREEIERSAEWRTDTTVKITG